MRMLPCLLSVLLLAPGFARAVDLVTKDGTTYPDVTIAETTPIGLSFIAGGKAGWVDFRDLPDDVAKKYGYDPKKAADFEAQLEKNGGNMVSPKDMPETSSMPPDAALNPPSAPPTDDNTVVVNPGQTVLYEPSYFPSSGPVHVNRWVYWHGHRYPYYWWHHWYWGHHWVWSGGRYWPWHYYHGHGVWYHGKYYPYHHGVLGPHRCPEGKPHEAGHHAKPRPGEGEKKPHSAEKKGHGGGKKERR